MTIHNKQGVYVGLGKYVYTAHAVRQNLRIAIAFFRPWIFVPHQDVGKQLLAIRTKVNTEITRMIMLRESTGQVRARKDDCDCGILGEVVDGLDGVLNQDKDEETVVEEGEFVNMMAGAARGTS